MQMSRREFGALTAATPLFRAQRSHQGEPVAPRDRFTLASHLVCFRARWWTTRMVPRGGIEPPTHGFSVRPLDWSKALNSLNNISENCQFSCLRVTTQNRAFPRVFTGCHLLPATWKQHKRQHAVILARAGRGAVARDTEGRCRAHPRDPGIELDRGVCGDGSRHPDARDRGSRNRPRLVGGEEGRRA